MKRPYLLAILIIVTLGACSQSAPDPMETGAALLAPFKMSLKSALMDGMQDGPEVAIAVCSEAAPAIASSISVDGVRVGRSSHKLRNPENAPPDWLAPILDDYVAGNTAARTVSLDDGRTGYVEPIMTQPLCLNCHGTDLLPEVAARINELYPEDEATGFGEGDLRGVFWVEF